MSSMLEQAVVDAQALREAALKNAEQTLIEKFAPQIKEAVETILEEEQINESELDSIPQAATAPDGEVKLSAQVFEFSADDFNVDLGSFEKTEEEKQEAASTEPEAVAGPADLETDLQAPPDPSPAGGDAGGDLLGGGLLEESDDLVNQLAEILEGLVDDEPETETIEEELTVDTGDVKHGHIVTDKGARKYDAELELAHRESTKYKEENEALEKKIEELDENLKKLKQNNKKLSYTVVKLNENLQEAILSNAKLLYSNRILGDASLNERQKNKIVEAIASAKSAKEAKSLCETLKATVGSRKERSPKSLSESVQRKSNLSSILPRRKQEETKDLPFADRMQRLAGIK